MSKINELVEFMHKYTGLHAEEYKRYAESLLLEETRELAKELASQKVNANHGETLNKLSEQELADATYNSPAYKEFKQAEAKELAAVIASSAYRAGDGQIKACNCIGPDNCRDMECALVLGRLHLRKEWPLIAEQIPEIKEAFGRIKEARPLTNDERKGVDEFVMSHFTKCSDNPECPLRSDVSPSRKLAGEIRAYLEGVDTLDISKPDIFKILKKYDGQGDLK